MATISKNPLINIQNIFKKNIVLILITTLLCGACGYYFGFKKNNNAKYKSTVFLSIAIKNKSFNESPYESVQTADHMTESIQGWIKDLSFQENIRDKSKINTELQAKRQEKNNIIVNFNTLSTEDAQKVGKIFLNQLNQRIFSYNLKSDFLVNADIQPLFTQARLNTTYIYMILGLLIGLCTPIITLLFIEEIKN